MNLDGEFDLAASRKDVWEALNDTEVLKNCVPGCEALEKISDTQFEALVRAKVGPLNAKFKTDISLRDVNPPESYSLVAKSKGGAAGMGEGVAQVELLETGTGTQLKYVVEFKVQGKLAQIGSRLLMNVIQKMSNQFFSDFASHFAPGVEPEVGVDSAPTRIASADKDTGNGNRLVLIASGIVAAMLGYWFLAA